MTVNEGCFPEKNFMEAFPFRGTDVLRTEKTDDEV